MDDVFELGRNIGVEANRGGGSSIENRFEKNAAGLAAKGKRAGAHFVEHRAEGEKVGAGVEVFAPNLLGRHVSDGAHGAAGTGELLFVERGHGVIWTELAGGAGCG